MAQDRVDLAVTQNGVPLEQLAPRLLSQPSTVLIWLSQNLAGRQQQGCSYIQNKIIHNKGVPSTASTQIGIVDRKVERHDNCRSQVAKDANSICSTVPFSDPLYLQPAKYEPTTLRYLSYICMSLLSDRRCLNICHLVCLLLLLLYLMILIAYTFRTIQMSIVQDYDQIDPNHRIHICPSIFTLWYFFAQLLNIAIYS